jgi:hypothetical protein
MTVRSDPLSDGEWYLHVRAIDNVGNASEVSHFGPFLIDATPPEGCWIDAPRYSNNETCRVRWSYYDATSGIASYDVEVLSPYGTGNYEPWLTDTTATSAVYDQGAWIGTYEFQVRAKDVAGNQTLFECTDETLMRDLWAEDLEVTQGIQNLNNEMALIRGKTTYVRFYAGSSPEDMSLVDARLHGTRNGQPLPGSPLEPLRGRVTLHWYGSNRDLLDDTFIFRLPPEWRSGTVELTAVLDPNDEVPEFYELNNELAETVTFEQPGYFCVTFVPVYLPSGTYRVNEPSFWPIVKLFKWLYPVGDHGVGIYYLGTMYPEGHASGWHYSIPRDYDVILQDLAGEDFWHQDPCSEDHWYGMVHPRGQGRTGIGNCPGDEAAGVMLETRGTNWPVPVGGAILAHELGHNFNRQHVWCTGEEEGVDRNYPYEEDVPHEEDDSSPYTCHIYRPQPGDVDEDAYFGLLAPPGGPLTVVEPRGTGDLMSYFFRLWPSDWTYRSLHNKLRSLSGLSTLSEAETLAGADAPGPAEKRALAWESADQYLYATGIISPTGQTADLGRFYVTSEPEAKFVARSYQQELAALEGSATYSLVLEDAAGNALYEHIFTVEAGVEGMSHSPTHVFSEVFPYVPAARIVLRQGETELASRAVSANAPTVTVLSPNGGETIDDPLTISWTATDADDDELRYTVQYSPDDGRTWRVIAVNWGATEIEVSGEDLFAHPGSSQARVRVTTTDGVNTGQDTSDGAFTLARRAPQAFILEPETMSTHDPGSTIVLVGTALDPEDATIGETGLFAWRSSLIGALGSGPELWVSDLPLGAHRIVLTVTDSDGQTGSAEITLLVGDALPWVLDLDPDTMNLQAKLKAATAYIELGEGYDVAQIDVETVRLAGVIPAERHPTTVGDHDGDGVPDLMVKFDWQAVVAYLEGTLGEVQLTVNGELLDGTLFEVSDTVTVIDEGRE